MTEHDDSVEILGVLESIRRGWETMDGEAVLGCFEPAATTIVIGTDAPEYWIGYDSFVEPFRSMAGTFTDGDYRWTEGPSLDIEGAVAWSTGKLLGVFRSDDDRIELDMRATHVLRRSSQGWRIVQAHYSVAASEPVPYD